MRRKKYVILSICRNHGAFVVTNHAQFAVNINADKRAYFIEAGDRLPRPGGISDPETAQRNRMTIIDHTTDERTNMPQYMTVFGSLLNYRKGSVISISEDPKRFVFSNIFEVANKSAPWERVVVGKNFEYTIEVARAQDTSAWHTAAHDEFVTCMDGKVEVHLIKLDNPDDYVDPESEGAHLIKASMPTGRKMGRIVLGLGHMAMLPVGSAYRFVAQTTSCLLFQSLLGPVSVEKWAEICQH
jgi:hypothetical protein